MIKTKRAKNKTTLYWETETPNGAWELVFEDIANYNIESLRAFNLFHGIKPSHIFTSSIDAKPPLLIEDMAQLSLNLSQFLELASKNAVLQNKFVMRDARKLNDDLIELLTWMHNQP